MSHPVRAARRRIRTEHGDVVESVHCCADRVVEPWDTARTTDPTAVTEPLQEALESVGLLERFPAVLSDVVDAAGHELRGEPVAAPPYVVVASRGPMLRATIDPGRLVVRFDAFEVVRNPEHPATYRRRDGVEVVVSLE